MNKPRMLAFGVLSGLVAALCLPAGPVSAHGALTAPVSRAAACGTEGGATARSAACQAAVAASGPGAASAWDNLRVANVNGRDRSMIADGHLCSGGLAQYAGLDLARPDWPTTMVTPGAGFTFTYRTTIPHQGTFRLYITKPGYQSETPLRWNDLETKPFLTVTDPPLRNDAYTLPGAMPTGRAGHHVIYTIWQNASTPDTYYSCSDVAFPAQPRAAEDEPTTAANPSSPLAAPAEGGSANDAEPAAVPGGSPADETGNAVTPSVAAASTGIPHEKPWPLIIAVAVALLLIASVGLLALRFRPRPRHRA